MEQFLHKKEISHRLFFLTKHLDNFGKLIKSENFPKTSMFTGNKGQGKYTLISHLLFSIRDDMYDNKNYQINKNSKFYNSFYSGINTNFISIDSSLIKIDDIRELKINILSKKINNEKRFIVFDDIDLINLNCANALLKIIEEPLNNDYFFLINNKTQNIIETIKSRCVEFKMDMDFEAEFARLKSLMDEKDSVNIFLSEGAGTDAIIKEMEASGEQVERDAFGHVALDTLNPGQWFAKQFTDRLGAEKTLVQKSGYFGRSAAPNQQDLELIKASGKLGVSMALQSRSGVIGLDDDKGSELSLIDFKRIKGGKPFDYTVNWFNTLMAEIGQ